MLNLNIVYTMFKLSRKNKTERINKIMQIIVPVSGGKDSQACLKLAVDKYGAENVQGMFCDTYNEHPMTYSHIALMEILYGVEIITVIDHKFPGRNVWERIRNRGQFPRDNTRFCTQQLKIQAACRYYKELLTTDRYKDGYQVWYGMRGTDESTQRTNKYSKYIPMDIDDQRELIDANDMNSTFPKKLAKQNVWFVLPVVEWTTQDIFHFLGDDINPLYNHGFKRVGCFPCFACATPKQLIKAYSFDEFGASQLRKVKAMEIELGVKHKNSNTEQACSWCDI